MKNLIILLILTFSLNCANLYGQKPLAIRYETVLVDEDDNPYSINTCLVTVSIATPYDSIYFMQENLCTTDSSGRIKFSLRNLPEFTLTNPQDTVIFTLNFSNTQDSPLFIKEDLNLTFFLSKNDTSKGYLMTRFDGKNLSEMHGQDLWVFSDLTPYSEAKSSFYISFNPDIIRETTISKAYIQILMRELRENEKASKSYTNEYQMKSAPPPASSRGIKGAYAVGGKNKKTKKK